VFPFDEASKLIIRQDVMSNQVPACAIDFAYEAMRDARDTIRAIDFKANALLVVLAIAGTSVDKIANAERYLLAHSISWTRFSWEMLGIAAAAAWIVSITCTCCVLASRHGPLTRIHDRGGAKGVLFQPRATSQGEAFSLEEHIKTMALPEQLVHRELCYEHLKLVAIRQTKTRFFRVAIWTGVIGVVALGVILVAGVLSGSLGSTGS
jgi:hypothetical protein